MARATSKSAATTRSSQHASHPQPSGTIEREPLPFTASNMTPVVLAVDPKHLGIKKHNSRDRRACCLDDGDTQAPLKAGVAQHNL